jgi:histone-lysine N-methyltransferase SUV39H
MKERSKTSRFNIAANKIRSQFVRSLELLPGKPVKLVNTRDTSTPPLSFTFIDDYVYREGVEPPDPAMMQGCGLVPTIHDGQTCRPNMGLNCGCQYTRTCECLEYAKIDETRLKDHEIARWQDYEQGLIVPLMGLPKRFPYSKDTGLLVKAYLGQRWPIYECNDNCACGPICKSRIVQKGRTVGLEIFRTKNRGWGMFIS